MANIKGMCTCITIGCQRQRNSPVGKNLHDTLALCPSLMVRIVKWALDPYLAMVGFVNWPEIWRFMATKLDEISRVGIGNVENLSVKWNLKEKSRYFELVEMFDGWNRNQCWWGFQPSIFFYEHKTPRTLPAQITLKLPLKCSKDDQAGRWTLLLHQCIFRTLPA